MLSQRTARATRTWRCGWLITGGGGFQITGDVACQRLGRDDACEWPPPEDPAAQRPVVADVHRQHYVAILFVTDLLRRMPHARADIRSDLGVKCDFYVCGGSGVYTERVGEDVVAHGLTWGERLFLERH